MSVLNILKNEATKTYSAYADCLNTNGFIKKGRKKEAYRLAKHHMEVCQAVQQWEQWKKEGWNIQ